MFRKSVVSVVVLAALGVACSSSESPETKSAGAAPTAQTANTQTQAPTSGGLPAVDTELPQVVDASPVRLMDNGAVSLAFNEASEGEFRIGSTQPVTIAPEVVNRAMETEKEMELASVNLPVTHGGQSFDVVATAVGTYNKTTCQWVIVWKFKLGAMKTKKRVDIVIINRLGELEVIRAYTLQLQHVLVKVPSKVLLCNPGKGGKDPSGQHPIDNQIPIDAQKPGVIIKDPSKQAPIVVDPIQVPKPPIEVQRPIDVQG